VSFTLIVLCAISLGIAFFAIVVNIQNNRTQDVYICEQVDNLRVAIYLTAIDLDADPTIISRFQPIKDCG
jgi:hypothetical protein